MAKKQGYAQVQMSEEAVDFIGKCFCPEYVPNCDYRKLGNVLGRILRRFDPIFVKATGFLGISCYSRESEKERDARFSVRAYLLLSHIALRLELGARASGMGLEDYLASSQDSFPSDLRKKFFDEYWNKR